MRPKASWAGLICRTDQCFKHPRDFRTRAGWKPWNQSVIMQSSSQTVTINQPNKPTPNFLQARCPFCHPSYPTNSVQSLKGKCYFNFHVTTQTELYPYHCWYLLKAKDDGGVSDNWTNGTINRAKLQSNHHHQQTNIQFFYRPDALPVAQPTVSKHWRENITLHGLAYPKLTKLPTLWPLIAPGYLGGGMPCLSSALWCQYPKL